MVLHLPKVDPLPGADGVHRLSEECHVPGGPGVQYCRPSSSSKAVGNSRKLRSKGPQLSQEIQAKYKTTDKTTGFLLVILVFIIVAEYPQVETAEISEV